MRRRDLLGLAATLPLAPLLARAQPAARGFAEDFDTMWRGVDEGYAYFDGARAAWRRARDLWRPRAAGAKTLEAFARALDGTLAELRDDHVGLSGKGIGVSRRVPAETDIWARFAGPQALVTAVRASTVADVAGLHPGHVVVGIQGLPVEHAIRDLLGPKPAGAAARDWALRHVLAGPREGMLRLEVAEGRSRRTLEIERGTADEGSGPPLVARRIGENRDLGYIRVKNNLGDPAFVGHFDAALTLMGDTRGLILDLRETSAGGTEAGVRAVLSRFVAAESPWQAREGAGRPRIVDTVAPRGAWAYRAALVVLVDRWTAAEGEALAAGLEAVARATLIGTPMAGLRGRARTLTLPRTGLALRFPAERTFHVNGTPREAIRPAIDVDLAAPSGGPGDPILYQGLKRLEGTGVARR